MDPETPHHATSRPEAAAVASSKLLEAIESAIRTRSQSQAVSLVERYGALDQPPEPLIRLLLSHAVEHDGALHNEKIFRTAVEGFESSRPKFRWLHLAALARVCASSFGFESPGLAASRKLLMA
jgi:hypothetical protein